MKEKKPLSETEELPDAWNRFERAVDIALHTRPKHKTKHLKAAVAQKGKSRPDA